MFDAAQGELLHVNSTAAVSDSRPWTHPKITPFRLAFILTTGGLGIVKAALVSNGKTASSTTVEWIAGVVVALIFQFLGACEYSNTRPQYLNWLFSYDCLGRLGTAISELHLDLSPSRLSLDGSELPPIATGYRLFVSTMFAAFGLAKMFCGYLGLSSAMYTLDWVIAVPLTLGLYYIGLYEECRAKSLHKFFEVDYSLQTKTAFVYLNKIALCGYWFKFWLGALRANLAYSYPAPSHDDTQEDGVWDAIFEHSFNWIATYFCIGMLETGVLSLGGVLWPIIKAFSGRYTSSIRYGSLLMAYLTLCAFFFLLYIYVVLFFLFYLTQISAPFSQPPISLLERMAVGFLVISSASMGVPLVYGIFKVPKLLVTFGRSLLN